MIKLRLPLLNLFWMGVGQWDESIVNALSFGIIAVSFVNISGDGVDHTVEKSLLDLLVREFEDHDE